MLNFLSTILKHTWNSITSALQIPEILFLNTEIPSVFHSSSPWGKEGDFRPFHKNFKTAKVQIGIGIRMDVFGGLPPTPAGTLFRTPPAGSWPQWWCAHLMSLFWWPRLSESVCAQLHTLHLCQQKGPHWFKFTTTFRDFCAWKLFFLHMCWTEATTAH